MHRTLASAAAASVAALAVVAASPAAQQPTFVAGTDTVAIYATVTNAQGRLVPDLTRDDFTVDDNGKRQALSLFVSDTQPITVVMLLDRSGSMKPNFKLEEQAAMAFLREMLPFDKARIGTFSRRIEIEPGEFTSDRVALRKILEGDLQQDGPTPLWNAVDAGIDKLLPEKGRRVVLVFTDGVDRPLDFEGHSKSLKDVMKRAEEQNVMVYAIGMSGRNGLPGPTGRGDARGGMNPGAFGGLGGRGMGGYSGNVPLEDPDPGLARIAEATGGGYFEPKSAVELAPAFARVALELHNQYAMGFTPDKLDGKMHELIVKTTKPELKVRARTRYLAAKK